MTGAPDFTQKPVPAPAAGTAPVIHLDRPLPSSRVIVTDETRRNLQVLGWEEGDPIPGDLGRKIQELQAKMADADAATAQGILVEAKELQKKSRTKHLRLEDMPPEYQEELRESLAEAKQAFAQEQAATTQQAEIRKTMSEVPPALQAAALANLQAQQSVQSVPETLPQPPASGTARVAGLAPIFTEPAEAATPIPDPAPIPAAAPTAEDAPDATAPDAGGEHTLDCCPRCLWDLSADFSIKPTDAEREQFVVSLLGPTRFCKQYSIVGGKLGLTFRTLTTNEADTVFTQLSYDVRAGKIQGQGEYLVQLNHYRLATSLATVAGADGAVLSTNPLIADVDYDDTPLKEETVLIPFLKWFYESILPNESLRRIAGQHLLEFQRLVEALEAQTSQPDFWQGIGQPL